MNRAMSLRFRSFLFSFVPMCLALAASFFAISAGLKDILRDRLKRSIYKLEAVIQQEDARYQQRNTELVGILSENAALKAAMALSLETLPSGGSATLVR